jgi:carboxymethylenebutenolidase
MARRFVFALALALVFAPAYPCSATNTPASALPRTVEIPSGNLRLKAFLWMPEGKGPFPVVLFNHGSGGATADETAGMPITEAASRLAPVFVNHGYAFLFLFRRGQGLSADQAPYMQGVLNREQATHGLEARRHLQLVLLKTEQLDDVMAALAFLKTAPGIDPRRIAIVGHSFGGQLALLAAERDTSIRAVVTFGAAANSWQTSPDLRALLLTAVSNIKAPIMLIHAANDYDTAAGTALASQRRDSHNVCVLKIYPAVGKSSDDGHNAVYQAIPLWEGDVLEFLDAQVKH